jgi:small-conductance mechanosensitive channel
MGLVIGLKQAFGVEIVGLVTTSGILIAIIVFALRGMISDIFAGIALNIERPLKKGDWIELNDGSIGQVQEINWRATRLLTREK